MEFCFYCVYSLTGETKKVSYLVNKSADTAAESVDGLKAIAPAGSYSLTLPAVGTGPSFTSTVSSEDFDDLSATAVAKKLVDNIREQALKMGTNILIYSLLGYE